jgi:hypothetical protein
MGAFVLAAYRLSAPGSEWRLHCKWFKCSAQAGREPQAPQFAAVQMIDLHVTTTASCY